MNNNFNHAVVLVSLLLVYGKKILKKCIMKNKACCKKKIPGKLRVQSLG